MSDWKDGIEKAIQTAKKASKAGFVSRTSTEAAAVRWSVVAAWDAGVGRCRALKFATRKLADAGLAYLV